MMKSLKKISKTTALCFLVVAVFIYIINIFTNSILSVQPKMQHDAVAENRQALNTLFNDKKLQKNPYQKLSLGIMKMMTCATIGEVCTNNPDDGEKNFSKSLVGGMTAMTSTIITHPPSSGVLYAYDTLQHAGLIPKTYAAEGIGIAALGPFKVMWNVFRNISYGILVVIMVAIGFMIMMRMKLSAQTAISIENSLPRIVIALLLITFSFAISGFLIDFMYLLMAIIISLLLQGAGPTFASHIGELQNAHLTAGPSVIVDSMLPNQSYANYISTGGSSVPFIKLLLAKALDTRSVDQIVNIFSLGNSLLLLLPGPIRALVWILGGIGSLLVTSYVIALFSNSGAFDIFTGLSGFTFSLGNLPKPLTAVPATLIMLSLFMVIGLPVLMGIFIFITILLLFFRIFFLLLKAYLMMMLYIIFAPMYMLFEAIPGNKSFSTWFRSLLGEVLTFPIVTTLFMLGYIFVNSYSTADATNAVGASFLGPTFWAPPYLYGLNQSAFVYVVGMGLLFMIPDLVGMAKDMLGLKSSGLANNAGIGMFFGGAAVGLGGGLSLFSKGAGLINTFGGSGATKDLMKNMNLTGFLRAPFTKRNDQTSKQSNFFDVVDNKPPKKTT